MKKSNSITFVFLYCFFLSATSPDKHPVHINLEMDNTIVNENCIHCSSKKCVNYFGKKLNRCMKTLEFKEWCENLIEMNKKKRLEYLENITYKEFMALIKEMSTAITTHPLDNIPLEFKLIFPEETTQEEFKKNIQHEAFKNKFLWKIAEHTFASSLYTSWTGAGTLVGLACGLFTGTLDGLLSEVSKTDIENAFQQYKKECLKDV